MCILGPQTILMKKLDQLFELNEIYAASIKRHNVTFDPQHQQFGFRTDCVT